MKIPKVIGIYVSIFMILISVSGCVWFTYHYDFGQEVDNIVSIDICRYQHSEQCPEMTVICTLDASQTEQFVADIAALDSYKYFGDFSRTFDGIVVYITYKNGEGEVLSAFTTADVDSSGTWYVRTDNFDKKDFYSIILKYVDSSLVPELEGM